MRCTKKQAASNRKNARRSTGPRTAAGKAQSRRNAFKHGLCGDGVVVPVEDARAIEAHYQTLAAEIQPETEAERQMTRRAAFLIVRVDRCVEREHDNLTKAVTHAIADYDARLMAEVDALVKWVPDSPFEAIHKLGWTAQGVDWQIGQWRDLRESLERNRDLNRFEIDRAETLQGRRLDATGTSSIKALALATGGDFSHLGLKRPDPSKSEAIKDRARLELDKHLGSQVDRLQAHRATLDHQAAERNRLEAPYRAMVDTTTAGELLRRYETAAAREVHKIFSYFDAKKADTRPEKPTLTPVQIKTSGDLASFRNSPRKVLSSEAKTHLGDDPKGRCVFAPLDGTVPNGPRAPESESCRAGGDDG